MRPKSIYDGKFGFHITYASIYGDWGKGIYFAKNASTSDDQSYSIQSGERQIFLAEVLLGDYLLPFSPRDNSLKMPPLNPAKGNQRYDCVKGNSKGGDVYIVY